MPAHRAAGRALSTFVLGFAASEAGGRFRGRSRAQLDGDLKWLEESLVELVEQARNQT